MGVGKEMEKLLGLVICFIFVGVGVFLPKRKQVYFIRSIHLS